MHISSWEQRLDWRSFLSEATSRVGDRSTGGFDPRSERGLRKDRTEGRSANTESKVGGLEPYLLLPAIFARFPLFSPFFSGETLLDFARI